MKCVFSEAGVAAMGRLLCNVNRAHWLAVVLLLVFLGSLPLLLLVLTFIPTKLTGPTIPSWSPICRSCLIIPLKIDHRNVILPKDPFFFLSSFVWFLARLLAMIIKQLSLCSASLLSLQRLNAECHVPASSCLPVGSGVSVPAPLCISILSWQAACQ